MSTQNRGPAKRKVKPAEPQSLLDFDLGEGESSDDSDFRIEDHAEESDDYSINSDDENKQHGASSSSDEESGSDDEDGDEPKTSSNKNGEEWSVAQLLERAKENNFKFPGDIANVLICAGCLGSRSDDFNEIVECDGCGVTVHEGCYGVSDVTSESSTVSSASTEPWFCEACKAGVKEPDCELCPNKGGIFKETEVGAWVHLVCALYVPGVAFSEVERLSGVTLFEMAYSRWGARECALCPDASLARTGVAVGCDAGLCKTFFHVTCGQREGLLAEAHSEEAEQADPFYAHCKLHSDKALVSKRKRNWLALQLRTHKRKIELQTKLSEAEKARIQRKLVKYTRKYLQHKENRNPPWVPTQKMARMVFSSASAMRRFKRKAECMGLDTHALEFQGAQMAALKDVSRRWHIPPAFSVEFVGYYLERNARVTALRASLDRLARENERLLAEDELLRADYDEASKENTEKLAELSSTCEFLKKIYAAVSAVCPKKAPPAILGECERPLLPPVLPRSTPKVTPYQLHKRSMSVPTAAALKMGVGFPLSDNPDARYGKVLSTSAEASCPSGRPAMATEAGGAGGAGVAGGVEVGRECCVCALRSEAALMAACDTCRRHYHLHCLDPPLPRPPKKSKLYGWQCSECDKTSDSEPEVLEKKVPRRSRIRYSKDGAILPPDHAPPTTASPLASASDDSPPKKKDKQHAHKTEKITKVAIPSASNASPIKVTIKPFDFSSDGNESEVKSKKEKKIKKNKLKEHSGAPDDVKKLKRSFTSPALTNTPLMSITPIVADSPNDSHNENSNASTVAPVKQDSLLSDNLSFSSLLNEAKERDVERRDSKAIESSIESTLANLSSDIATYKANRKRRKEKHRARYSPDLPRAAYKHKHKRKKKALEHHPTVDVPHEPHPRITIKLKPLPAPAGCAGRQLFYVPSAAHDGPPPALIKKLNKQVAAEQEANRQEAPGLAPVAESPAGGPAEPAGAPVPDTEPTAATPPQPPAQEDTQSPEQLEPKQKPKAVKRSVAQRSRTTSMRGSGAAAGAAGGGDARAALAPLTQCDVCTQPGTPANIVRCDECHKRYHFTCLEPPLNKNPKKRGYSWHCADCDPTEPEDNN